MHKRKYICMSVGFYVKNNKKQKISYKYRKGIKNWRESTKKALIYIEKQ